MTSLRVPGTIAATLAAIGLFGAPARADYLYQVQMDTSALVGHAAGPFSIDFQLIDGDGVADNTVTLSQFAFGGGGPLGAASLTGGASGDLSSLVTLTDSAFLNAFVQPFTPGATLSFRLSTTSVFAGGVPDAFSFAILDSTGVELPTTGFSGAFVQLDLEGGEPLVQTFGSDPAQAPAAGGAPVSIAPPTVRLMAASAPEPGALALLAVAALPMAGCLRAARARRA